jgi:hypothetical protein
LRQKTQPHAETEMHFKWLQVSVFRAALATPDIAAVFPEKMFSPVKLQGKV